MLIKGLLMKINQLKIRNNTNKFSFVFTRSGHESFRTTNIFHVYPSYDLTPTEITIIEGDLEDNTRV